MDRLKSVFLGFVILPAVLHAGQVYGSVTDGGKGVAGAAIEIACPGGATPGATAGDGSYRINVPQQGQCNFTLPGLAGRPTAVVFSYPNPTQYDFLLVKHPDGTYELRRR